MSMEVVMQVQRQGWTLMEEEGVSPSLLDLAVMPGV